MENLEVEKDTREKKGKKWRPGQGSKGGMKSRLTLRKKDDSLYVRQIAKKRKF